MFGWLRRLGLDRQATRRAQEDPGRPITLPPLRRETDIPASGSQPFAKALSRSSSLHDEEARKRIDHKPAAPIIALPPWLARLPEKVAFVDVETTGLTSKDRIVSFAAILLNTPDLGQFDVQYVHYVFNPGRKSHPRAKEVHGYSDWFLRNQEPFAAKIDTIEGLLKEANLIVAHNVEFDMDFLEREFAAHGRTVPATALYCTMHAHRRAGLGGSASLTACAARLGLRRGQDSHSALQDAWFTMNVYLAQLGCPHRAKLSAVPILTRQIDSAGSSLPCRRTQRPTARGLATVFRLYAKPSRQVASLWRSRVG